MEKNVANFFFVSLVTLIARDLQQEFYPFFLPVMNCIVDLLPNSDSDSLEVYNTFHDYFLTFIFSGFTTQ